MSKKEKTQKPVKVINVDHTEEKKKMTTKPIQLPRPNMNCSFQN